MVAYRATPHPATGFTPNRIMLGRETRLYQVMCPESDPKPRKEKPISPVKPPKEVCRELLGLHS